jgi:hypothetical protein
LSGERLERRLAAILAADVVGYSRLMASDVEGTLGGSRPFAPSYWTRCPRRELIIELSTGRGTGPAQLPASFSEFGPLTGIPRGSQIFPTNWPV